MQAARVLCLTRFNRMTGEMRDVEVYPRFFSGEEAKVLPERWQWTFPIVFSPVDRTQVIYLFTACVDDYQ